jgi:hypothetical protein
MTEHQGVFRNASLAVYGACGFREIIGLCEELSFVAVGTPVDPTPPAQIRTGRIAAYGSYLG